MTRGMWFASALIGISSLSFAACGDDSGDGGSGGSASGGTSGASGSGGTSTGGSAGSGGAATGGSAGSGGIGGTAGMAGAAGAGGSAGAAASACATITQVGASVSSQNVTGTLPSAAGGSIVTGTYVLSATKYYDSSSSSPADTQTMVVAAGSGASVFDVTVLHGATGCETFTWTTNGTDVSVEMLTPQQQSAGTLGYTATSTEIHLFKASANREIVYTLK
jgi:hypothetical protein